MFDLQQSFVWGWQLTVSQDFFKQVMNEDCEETLPSRTKYGEDKWINRLAD